MNRVKLIKQVKNGTVGKVYDVYCVSQSGPSCGWAIDFTVKGDDGEWLILEQEEVEILK